MNRIRPIVAALALFCSATAHASLVMSWSFTKTGETLVFGSGTFTADLATDETVANVISYNELNGGPSYTVGPQKDFYVMTGATGTINGTAISLLDPASTYGADGITTVTPPGFAGNDNVVLEPHPDNQNANAFGYFTSFGVSFVESGAVSTMWNLFVSPAAGGPIYQFINSLDYTEDEEGVRYYAAIDGTFTLETTGDSGRVEAVPIPAAAWLLLSGVASLFLAGRRRSAQASPR
jgi:hypothetical protein